MADNLEIDGDDRPLTSQLGRGLPSKRKKWTRRILTIGIALGALTAFVVIVFNAYDRGKQPAGDKAAPIIKAEKGPLKVRPKQPGGMDVPNQDKQVYRRISPVEHPPQVEHLIPPPEVDVSRPPPPAQTAAVPPPPAGAPALAQPPPAIVAPPIPPPVAAAPAGAKAPEPPPRVASLPAPAPRTPAAVGGRYRVQIAALRSEAAAKRNWASLTKRYADLFGGLQPSVERVDLGPKGVFYRLQAGPFADEAAARAMCSRAKQRKLGCIVVKP